MVSDHSAPVCICGHPKKKHKKTGKCTKCSCKRFSEESHPKDCRCNGCLWSRVLHLEDRDLFYTKHFDEVIAPALSDLETKAENLLKYCSATRNRLNKLLAVLAEGVAEATERRGV